MSPAQPHDSFFRTLLDDPEWVDAFLRERLPPNLTALLTDEGFHREETSFVSETLGTLHADGLFSTRCRDGNTLYVILEHKSWPDSETPLRMARYTLSVWSRHQQREEGKTATLPYVFLLVVYHGRRNWHVPRSVAEMASLPGEVFRYGLVDLVRTEFNALSGDDTVRASLGILRQGMLEDPDREELREALRILHRQRPRLLPAATNYILETYDLPEEEYRELLHETVPEVWETTMQTVAERLVAKGKAEGLTEGKADTLLRLLARRFDTVPEDTRTRIRAASIEELDAWVDAMLSASSLDEVFLNGVRH